MSLRSRSFRVTEETVARLKHVSSTTGRSIQNVMGASIAFFDPANNEEHMKFLKQYESAATADDMAIKISDMPPQERDKLLELLANSK